MCGRVCVWLDDMKACDRSEKWQIETAQVRRRLRTLILPLLFLLAPFLLSLLPSLWRGVYQCLLCVWVRKQNRSAVPQQTGNLHRRKQPSADSGMSLTIHHTHTSPATAAPLSGARRWVEGRKNDSWGRRMFHHISASSCKTTNYRRKHLVFHTVSLLLLVRRCRKVRKTRSERFGWTIAYFFSACSKQCHVHMIGSYVSKSAVRGTQHSLGL